MLAEATDTGAAVIWFVGLTSPIWMLLVYAVLRVAGLITQPLMAFGLLFLTGVALFFLLASYVPDCSALAGDGKSKCRSEEIVTWIAQAGVILAVVLIGVVALLGDVWRRYRANRAKASAT